MHEIEAEIGEPAGIAQPLPYAVCACSIEWRQIA